MKKYYAICNQADKAIFEKQCVALEKNIPDLVKGECLEDVDGSETQLYRYKDKEISVHNSYYTDEVYINSEIELEQFFE